MLLVEGPTLCKIHFMFFDTNLCLYEYFFFVFFIDCYLLLLHWSPVWKISENEEHKLLIYYCTSSIVKGLLKSCCCHLVTRVKGVSGDTPPQLHLRVGPGDDVSPEVAAARRQAVDVAGRQHVRPHVQVRHLTHKRLSSVKTTSQCILEESQPQSALMKGHFLQTGSSLCGRSRYLLLPQDEDPSRFDGMPGREIQAGPSLHTVLVGLPLSVPGGPGHAHMVPLPIVDRQRQCYGLWADGQVLYDMAEKGEGSVAQSIRKY